MQSLLEKATAAVLEAGEIIKESYNKPKKIKHKGRIDLVTETDLAVEEFLKAKLAEILPGSSFLAEETSGNAELVDRTWIIDPLDGTTNFAHGLPMVATSVALWKDDQVVLGIVNLPILNEVFTAVRGGGSFMNGEPIHVSDCGSLEESLIATGFPYAIEEHVDFITEALSRVLVNTQGVRRPGAAAFDLAYTSCGRYEGYYENSLKPWDMAAGWLLVEEAGGRVTEYGLGKFNLYSPMILATNSHIHEQLDGLIQPK
ncbi:inositol monophosphatase family protein [Maridesulfovibrio salexigens]|uniref:Inositol-1-monophosphatase n=1 Tax=Maridesulfovibrio salexigens (strain ATCC 14822 / DSM 2638 / NCIMB 8403 / VKM B-1763) TaxID=526222 RepID=C6BUI4_MARSD|nr:inositol monophosphatase family protein [Maridesulfovibrio salexigens]ACS79993.1 inositol monophosphatase [Maridesulfovibrio salexigens DSM 2638]